MKLIKEDLAKKLIEQGDAAGGIAEKKFNEREQAVNELIAEVAEKLFPVVVLGGRANVRRGGQLNGESLGKVFGNAETSDLFVESLREMLGASDEGKIQLGGGEFSTRYISNFPVQGGFMAMDVVREPGGKIPNEVSLLGARKKKGEKILPEIEIPSVKRE